ncbi:MAG: hypothetical protein L0191_09140, partial [Acidobacteria bacterium]|nr:hypothetical protein [Acidobacteriota bacterium]
MKSPFSVRHFALPVLLLLLPLEVHASGYAFHRLILWGEPGELPPRFQQNPESGAFLLLFPGPAPESGWDPVAARCFEVHGGAFLPEADVPIPRPRDPDPDWEAVALQGSLDVNRDGRAEVVQARTVMIPDHRDPASSQQRVLVNILEGERVLFADLVAGPQSSSVSAHSVSTTDFTGEGYPDFVIFLQAGDRTGAAFYSQRPLRSPGGATRRIDGSSSDFRCDAYGIFDLNRSPKDFFSRLPSAARSDSPGCPQTRGTEGDGLAYCRYQFDSPYLGWIAQFQVAFVPPRTLKAFELYFPAQGRPLTPEQAMAFLLPVFGGEYQAGTKTRRDGGKDLTWQWKG